MLNAAAHLLRACRPYGAPNGRERTEPSALNLTLTPSDSGFFRLSS